MKAPQKDRVPTPVQRLNKAWGVELRKRREELDMSQTALGRVVNRDQTSVSRFERGDGQWTPETMLAFAVALDTTVPALFGWPQYIEEMEKVRIQGSAA